MLLSIDPAYFSSKLYKDAEMCYLLSIIDGYYVTLDHTVYIEIRSQIFNLLQSSMRKHPKIIVDEINKYWNIEDPKEIEKERLKSFSIYNTENLDNIFGKGNDIDKDDINEIYYIKGIFEKEGEILKNNQCILNIANPLDLKNITENIDIRHSKVKTGLVFDNTNCIDFLSKIYDKTQNNFSIDDRNKYITYMRLLGYKGSIPICKFYKTASRTNNNNPTSPAPTTLVSLLKINTDNRHNKNSTVVTIIPLQHRELGVVII